MSRALALLFVTAVCVAAVFVDRPFARQQTRAGFFVTSSTSGTGNLGGLSGADQRCQELAKSAGLPNRAWRAYLSTSGPGGVSARDRIGSGPWYNVKGMLVAQNLAELHSDKANINNETALDEQGRTVNAQGAPNRQIGRAHV